MLSQLAQCEFAVTKSNYASTMMKQELKNYEQISQTIDLGIEHAKSQIEQSKENLVLAKKIRKNRMEYDVLAKVINQQPDRKKTTEKLEALKKELNELDNNRRHLQRKLEIRRNEFSVLMRSIKELQSKLDDGEDDGGGGINSDAHQSDDQDQPMDIDPYQLTKSDSSLIVIDEEIIKSSSSLNNGDTTPSKSSIEQISELSTNA